MEKLGKELGSDVQGQVGGRDGVWVEGWSKRGGGKTSIEPQSQSLDRMGAHVDVGFAVGC